MFKMQRYGPFCVKALAIVHGSSAASLTCVNPEPHMPLLTDQRALAAYMRAIGKCNCAIFVF